MKENLSIFKAWFVYIVCKKPLSQKAYDFCKENYPLTDRERKLMTRIAKLNNLEL